MRLGSASTCTTSGLTPAALCACRVAGPGSAPAASRAQDSSGWRSFPSTPAPAIWVVGVTRERVDGPVPDFPDPQPPHTTTTAAVTAVATSTRAGRITPNCTGLTLTPGRLGAVFPRRRVATRRPAEAFTTVCRTSPDVGIIGG